MACKFSVRVLVIALTCVLAGSIGIAVPPSLLTPAMADASSGKRVSPDICADSEKRWEYYGFAEAIPDGSTDPNQIQRTYPEGVHPDKQPTDSEDGLVIPHLPSSRYEIWKGWQENLHGNRSFLAREKPGDPSTIQIMVRRRKVEYYNDFNIPEGLGLPSKIMVITTMNENRNAWKAYSREGYVHTIGFDAKHRVEGAADLYAELSDPNKLQARNVKGLLNVRAVSIPYGKEGTNVYYDNDPSAGYHSGSQKDWKIYHNFDDRWRLNFSGKDDPTRDIGGGDWSDLDERPHAYGRP